MRNLRRTLSAPCLLVLAFLFLFFQPGLIVRSAGTDPNFGYQTVGSKNEVANYMFCTQASLPQTGLVTSISFYSGVSGNVKVGIYADSNGPSNLVIGPVERAGSTAGAWNTVTVTPTSLAPGTYWMCGQTNTAGAVKYDSVGTGRYAALAYGASWPGGFSDENNKICQGLQLSLLRAVNRVQNRYTVLSLRASTTLILCCMRDRMFVLFNCA